MKLAQMIRRILIVMLLPAVAYAAGKFQPGEEPRVSYSGVREMVSSQGTLSMKEYFAPQKQRMEMTSPTGDVVLINRRDKNSAYMLMPGMNMFMEIPSQQFHQQTGSHTKVIENNRVGRETLDGYEVDKYKSIVEGADGVRGEGYYWVTDDGIALKMDVDLVRGGKKEHMVMRLKQLKIGAQPASLFEVPPGYQAMPAMNKDMLSSMMGSAAVAGDQEQAQGKDDGDDLSGIKSVLEEASDVKSLFKKLF